MDLNMKCEEFKRDLNELVFEKLAATDKREDAMSHAALCADCALLLTETKDVKTALKSTARAEIEAAHPRVRAALLTAFSQQVPTGPVVDISTHRRRTRITVAMMTAAAAILMVAVLRPVILKMTSVPASQVGLEVVISATAPLLTATLAKAPKPLPLIPHAKPSRRMAVREPRVFSTSIARQTISMTNTNEYFPLTYLASATAMESGTVVRVQLSRAALISLGVPLSVDGTAQVLKADLIMGDDGVARAIRVVD
jgi:hypothetical protein